MVSSSALLPPSHPRGLAPPSLSWGDLVSVFMLGGETPPSVPATKHLVSGVSETDWGFRPPYHVV